MAITAAQVKVLRQKTGIGMMECKKALTNADGDLEGAIKWLRENGMSRAAKKADRVAAEGLVEVIVNEDQNAGVILELNCETDFASRNESFVAFLKEISAIALKNECNDVDKLKELTLENGETISAKLTNLIATVGENMNIRRVQVMKVDNGAIAAYSHMGGKIGTLVALEGAKSDKVTELGRDLAMHVAAAAPRYLHSTEVDTTELDAEKEIARKKLIEEKKPENLIEKILEGQMKKFYKEVCLVEQMFVKDPNVSITNVIKQSGEDVKIAAFSRFQLGEGIEKQEEDFAAEVAKTQAAAAK
jgi:elongation factor Ts